MFSILPAVLTTQIDDQNARRVKNHRLLPVLNRSSKTFFASFLAATFFVALSRTSGVTVVFRSTSSVYRVGMRWL